MGFVYCVELYEFVHKIEVHISAYSVITGTSFEVYGTTGPDNYSLNLFRLDIHRSQLRF